jgi:hypothetical protein
MNPIEIKIFDYIVDLDCFVINSDYKEICDYLGITEWEQAAWIGRYFTLDNDYGEHWFDNWELRDEKEAKAKELGVEYDRMLIIDPERFKNDSDGPCHENTQRKQFWTSTLKSLRLNIELIVGEARVNNSMVDESDRLNDLEKRIEEIKTKFGARGEKDIS